MEEKCCNLCGNPLDDFDTHNDFTIHKKIGYGSIYDTDKVELHLCCQCFDMLVGQCTKSPITLSTTEEEEESLLTEFQRVGVC